MSTLEQSFYHCRIGEDYPHPIVDLETSRKYASDMIWGHRKQDLVKDEAKRILATHTQRNSTRISKPRKKK
jgi:deoxyribodipyrimidine photo-lyase